MQFKNLTHPGQLPIEGDIVEYSIGELSEMTEWNLNTFELCFSIADDERRGGITQLAFRKLFTPEELLTIDNVEHSDSTPPEHKAIIATFY